jgi:hypothetical protein
MDNFQFWTNWGAGLSDEDFSNAFTALGVLAAYPSVIKSAGSGIPADAGKTLLEATVNSTLEGLMSNYPEPAKLPMKLSWRFPSPAGKLSLGKLTYKLSELDPFRLSVTWHNASNSLPVVDQLLRLRLQVLSYPKESFRQWYRILFESSPLEKSAYITFRGNFPETHMKWPLRLGYIPGNMTGLIVAKAHQDWPAKENTVVHEIGREFDNCDFLVFNGSTKLLLSSLKGLPMRMKCNLFIIRSSAEDNDPEFIDNLQEIANLSYANGFVFCKETLVDADFAEALNGLVRELTHNLQLDEAISKAFYNQNHLNWDPLIFLSKSLADFRIEHQAKITLKNIQMMPGKAILNVPLHTFSRLKLAPLSLPVPGGAISKRFKMPSLSPPQSPIVKAANLKRFYPGSKGSGRIDFSRESAGATWISEMNKAMQKAKMPENVKDERRERYISARTYRMQEDKFIDEKRAFIAGIQSKIIMRIGPPDPEWFVLTNSFPVEKLPKQKEAWRLTVVLSEPNHVPEPIISEIKLPQDGPSTECEFIFTLREAIKFEGRITVLHRGRVIQTGILKMPVVNNIREMPEKDQLQMGDVIPVKVNLSNLKARRQFDMAIVTNLNADNQPLMNVYGKDSAWLANLDGCKSIMESINTLLSNVANNVLDYKGGLKSEKGLEMFRKLIYQGCTLYDKLIKIRLHTEIDKSKFLESDYMQIITTNDSEDIVPFEFIYEHDAPGPKAMLCECWEKNLSENWDCRKKCDKNFRETICPLGFWGLSKVIERQNLSSDKFSTDAPNFIVRTKVNDDLIPLVVGSKCLIAASSNVEDEDLDAAIEAISKTLEEPPLKAISWSNWESLVQENEPQLIIAMPHHEEVDPAMLEINGDSTIGVLIYDTHVRKTGSKDNPIVALLGCDTAGTALQYGTFVERFHLNGASIVIGTVATVFGKHAATIADMLVQGLKAGSEEEKNNRMGEVMLSIKRKAVLDGLLMALCLVAFGDADCVLTKKPE